MPNHPRPRPIGLNHVAITVGDIDAAVSFYRSIFTFSLRGRSDTKAFIDMGDQFLAMAQTTVAADHADSTRHIGVVVDDASLVEDRLADIGVTPLDTAGLDFHDPRGNRLQIIEYADVQFTKAPQVLKGMDATELEKRRSAIKELEAKGMAPK